LNLTAATRIHILEPQWNPAVEQQAIGRSIRIGQEKNTTVIRYVVKNTVEEV
jgi:SNF2 family DNA or RNA helicase